MRKVKVAFIGANRLSHALQIIQSVKKQTDIFEIVGYTMPENEREKFPEVVKLLDKYKEMTLEEILNNPEIEAVVVDTEEIYLTKYALMAAQHGKHIHMEKPGGVSHSEFERLIATMKETKKVFHTGYMYRYNPYIIELMQKVKNGELGEIMSVEAHMSCCHTPENRQWLDTFPGGMMFFLGCHLVDLVLQIKGIPENVIPFNRSTGLDGVTAKDYAMAVFDYGNAVSFIKTSGAETGGFDRRQLVVSGTKGMVELKPLEAYDNGNQFTRKTEYKAKGPSETTDSEIYDRYDGMMASFAEMVRGEKENPWNYDYELTLHKYVLMACGIED